MGCLLGVLECQILDLKTTTKYYLIIGFIVRLKTKKLKYLKHRQYVFPGFIEK